LIRNIILSTKCIFLLVAQSKKTPQIIAFNLEHSLNGDLLGSFQECVRARSKHIENTHVNLWGQSTILKSSLRCYTHTYKMTPLVVVLKLLEAASCSFAVVECRICTLCVHL
jgi:hypothetical protein